MKSSDFFYSRLPRSYREELLCPPPPPRATPLLFSQWRDADALSPFPRGPPSQALHPVTHLPCGMEPVPDQGIDPIPNSKRCGPPLCSTISLVNFEDVGTAGPSPVAEHSSHMFKYGGLPSSLPPKIRRLTDCRSVIRTAWVRVFVFLCCFVFLPPDPSILSKAAQRVNPQVKPPVLPPPNQNLPLTYRKSLSYFPTISDYP